MWLSSRPIYRDRIITQSPQLLQQFTAWHINVNRKTMSAPSNLTSESQGLQCCYALHSAVSQNGVELSETTTTAKISAPLIRLKKYFKCPNFKTVVENRSWVPKSSSTSQCAHHRHGGSKGARAVLWHFHLNSNTWIRLLALQGC